MNNTRGSRLRALEGGYKNFLLDTPNIYRPDPLPPAAELPKVAPAPSLGIIMDRTTNSPGPRRLGYFGEGDGYYWGDSFPQQPETVTTSHPYHFPECGCAERATANVPPHQGGLPMVSASDPVSYREFLLKILGDRTFPSLHELFATVARRGDSFALGLRRSRRRALRRVVQRLARCAVRARQRSIRSCYCKSQFQ